MSSKGTRKVTKASLRIRLSSRAHRVIRILGEVGAELQEAILGQLTLVAWHSWLSFSDPVN